MLLPSESRVRENTNIINIVILTADVVLWITLYSLYITTPMRCRKLGETAHLDRIFMNDTYKHIQRIT